MIKNNRRLRESAYEDPKGVITIYLALTLVLTAALIFTMIESARISAAKYRAQSISYMAADSAFSMFAEPVFDKYGISLLWTDTGGLAESFETFANDNCSDSGNVLDTILYTDIYRLNLKEASVVSSASPVDRDGLGFEEQVIEYMKLFLAEDVIQRILEGTSAFEQGDKVTEVFDKIEEYAETFEKVEESVKNIKDGVDKAKEIADDPGEILDEMSGYLDDLEGGDSSASGKFTAAAGRLSLVKTELTSALENIKKSTDSYYEYVNDAKEAVSDIEGELELDEADYSKDIYDAVSVQIEDLKKKSADTDFDYYLAGQNEEYTEKYISKVNSLDGLIEGTLTPPGEDNIDSYRALVDSYSDEFEGFSMDDLGVNLNIEDVEKEDDSFLSDISDLAKGGLLGFIAGDISDKTVDISVFPSQTVGGQDRDDVSSQTGAFEKTTNKALFGEYILTHFGNASEIYPSAPLDYGVEYILTGKSADKDNLSSVISRIVLLRTGCNLISLLKSSSKLSQTEMLATSLVGFTGMPVVVKIFQILIISAWSVAEAIADAKALIEGHKVRTIKNEDEWYVSLLAIKNFTSDSIEISESDQGLDYEAYLRLLLLMQNGSDQRFRTMDMIQADMCLTENEGFRISDCITGAQFMATYTVPNLFVTFPFVSSLITPGSGGYTLNIDQTYTYNDHFDRSG